MSGPASLPRLPFGSWPSPISVDLVVASSRQLREVWLDREDVYWIEGRPDEGGRFAIVRCGAGGTIADVTPAGSNARSMVHEYGGGSYTVEDRLVVYSEMSDGRLYRQHGDRPTEPITAEGPYRYADLRIDSTRERVLCVREDHSAAGQEPESAIVAVSLSDGETQVLAHGADFYSHPRLDPSGTHLAWLTWSHPDMPWDASELWLAAVTAEGSLTGARRVAGGPGESIAQPEWAPDGTLVFCSDRTGWWNLYRLDVSPSEHGGTPPAEPLAPMDAEFAVPQWVFGQSTYAIDRDGTILAIARSEGRDRLFRLQADGRSPEEIDQPFLEMSTMRLQDRRAVYLGAGPSLPASIVRLDLATGDATILHQPSKPVVDAAYMAVPQQISFPSAGGRVAHALFYAPTNPSVQSVDGERPPLIVLSHGGPTAQASAAMDMDKQFFTTRGFAVVDVDYGGSSGYGRAYRQLLDGTWGIVDVEDCTAAARYLADRGLVDRARLFIRGGSAGGYTTLRALTTCGDFAAGSSHYGVGDLEALARDTHKFESRYLDRLVGPYPAAIETYRERSPIHATDRIDCPLIVFQGLDDRVVPPAQAEQLVAALQRKGLPYAYLTFAGEGHGFRRAENICRVLVAELSFFAQLFDFEPADELEAVPIANLASWRESRRAPQPLR